MLNFAFFKKCLGLVTPPYLRILFQQKLFFHVIFFNWLNFIVWWPLLLEILSKMYILIICATACCMVKLSLILRPYQAIFYIIINIRTSFWISLARKEIPNSNKNHFLWLLKGFKLPELSQTWECTFKGGCYFFLAHSPRPPDPSLRPRLLFRSL